MNKNVNTIQELKLLRSAVIGWIGADKEGGYNPKFVKELLTSSQDKPRHIFADKKSFLKFLAS